MGVSKNRGTPKWMVYMENPIKMDDLGVPLFFGNTHIISVLHICYKLDCISMDISRSISYIYIISLHIHPWFGVSIYFFRGAILRRSCTR